MTRIQAICAVFIILATVVFVTHVETRPEPPEEQPSPGTLESDIKLTKYQRQAIAEMVLEVESGASVRKALANLTYLWPNATLPYVISASSANNATLIKQALAYWESNTCIRFPLHDSPDENAPRIEFIKEFGCYSSVGYTGGFPQEISIGDFCVTYLPVV
uniref:Protein SpAN-like n=1 Tax=Saccoglossus kowalevskii TaxID=10224 RepID=A0ABM0MKX3_SACKO|nr:PREDICTED: protein SpAN-like [Saccoglossus kowalevskii]